MTEEHPPAEGLTASQRLALALGLPIPEPMTEDEIRELNAELDREDEEIRRFYRERNRRSAA
jgi:hypothetical protein